jgi:imidazolonepropionase-like amidohydrolase
MLGMEDRLGKVREGFIADLLVVNGNPLEDLKVLNPAGADILMVNGKPASNYATRSAGDRVQVVRGGGIEWTIKDGIPYHVPTLMHEVEEMVTRARERARTTTP